MLSGIEGAKPEPEALNIVRSAGGSSAALLSSPNRSMSLRREKKFGIAEGFSVVLVEAPSIMKTAPENFLNSCSVQNFA